MTKGIETVLWFAGIAFIVSLTLNACTTPKEYMLNVDKAANQIISDKQLELFNTKELITVTPAELTLRKRLIEGQNLPFSHPASLGSRALDRVPNWPDISYADTAKSPTNIPWVNNVQPLTINFSEAAYIAARNNNAYQQSKQQVFQAALSLDLEQDEFRNSFKGLLGNIFSVNQNDTSTRTGIVNSADISLTQRFKSGVKLITRIGVDLVKLLTLDKASSFGIFADTTISVPLLRGSGQAITTEALTQAERNVIYAIYTFERFRRSFIVQVASQYLSVIRQHKQINNSQQNYNNLLASVQRTRRLSRAGRLPDVQVNQTIQDALRALDRLNSARAGFEGNLDKFKQVLGLPPDANIVLDYDEDKIFSLGRDVLANNVSGVRKYNDQLTKIEDIARKFSELNTTPIKTLAKKQYITQALENRLDLRIAQGRVYDAQRTVIIAADNLRTEATFTGSARFGERRGVSSAVQADAKLRFNQGDYSGLLSFDLPWERKSEQIVFRNSLLSLEQTVRSLQDTEDQVKLDVKNRLRELETLELSMIIQEKAVEIANKRVKSTTLFMNAGRIQIRDLLEAEEAMLQAQNNFVAARVDYQIAILGLQRDLGKLQIDWQSRLLKFNDKAKQ